MKVERIIGRYDGEPDGPLLIFIAGIHGNETLGVQALKEIFEILESKTPVIHGSIIGLSGNVRALDKEVRYIDKDLNRLWFSDETELGISEYKEREELRETLNTELLKRKSKDVFFFDLHSTSSNSSPYIMMSDTLRNRELGRVVGLPIMLGLLEHLTGMLMDVTSRSGFPTLLFQGGGNAQEETLINHTGFISKLLTAKCKLDISAFPELRTPMSKLNSFAPVDEDHEFLEISYTYKVQKNDDFEMRPGYVNFQFIKKNEIVALSNRGEIRAPFSGRIFMPRYQKLGSEGFYVVKRIAAFWIKFSRKFRLFKYHHRLHWLLGVYKVGSNPLTFKVDQQVTFLWSLEVFHLLGYIKVRQDGPNLYMTRREDEIQPPTADDAVKNFTTGEYLRSELKAFKSEWHITLEHETVN